VTDLVEWLREQIAEDRSKAEVATPGPWNTSGPDTIAQWTIYDAEWSVASTTVYDHNKPMSNKPGARGPGYIDPDANAEHIARWDPARVLAECDAKLAILEQHPTGSGWDGDNFGCAVCETCAHYDHSGDLNGDPYPCKTLRHLALPYSDRPGYREEWKP